MQNQLTWFHGFTQNSADAYLLLTDAGHIISLNPAAITLTGYPPDLLVNQPIAHLVSSDKNLAPVLNSCREEGASKAIFLLKNAQQKKINLEASFSRTTDPAFLLVCLREIPFPNQEASMEELNTVLEQPLTTLKKVLDYSQDIICTCDINGNFKQVSRASQKIIGYAKEEVIGKNYRDFIYEPDLEKTVSVQGSILNGSPVSSFTNRFVRKDGTLAILSWSAYWSEDEKTLFSIGRDITELSLAQAQLESSEERFRSLVEHGSDLIALLSAEAKYIYVSDSAERILGIAGTSFIGKDPFQFIHPEDVPRILKHYEELFTSVQVSIAPYRFRDGASNWRWIETIVTNQLQNPYIGAFVASSRDITFRKENELRLQESEQKYKSLFDYHSDAVYSLNLEGNFVTANPKVETITGYHCSEIIGHKCHDLVLPEYLLETDKNFDKAALGESVTFDTAIFSKTGNPIYLNVTYIPIVVDKDVVGVFGIAKDISETKAFEQERQNLINRLEVKNNSLQQFAYIISHNLRAPVTNILGLTDLFVKTAGTEKINLDIIDYLRQTALNLDTVIRDLNEILTVQSNLNQIKTTVYFKEVTMLVIASITEEMRASQVTINTNFKVAPAVIAIKSYLHSILHNLITNAIKYKSPERHLVIELNTFFTGEYICLSVKDNALGIDLKKQKDYIFGLYKRFHSHVDGKGLGLHLIKTQVETMGGKVEVESEVGVGSTFKIYFKNEIL